MTWRDWLAVGVIFTAVLVTCLVLLIAADALTS